ncbi:DDE-type integrase/transposase/recombinase [Sedimentibacter sp. zth1]|uniref:integrase core domain-containing protein n=1 Tax=Sedimentibacter sp. zth1 TaxID=2816908 RepID=UPI001A929F78|nr:DDE-type integrase/transposase/recombinase [Sedimentibacter sp. zth1]
MKLHGIRSIVRVKYKQDRILSIDTINILAAKYDLNGCIIHSDQGVHYTNKEYAKLLESLGVTHSMSRKGNCWDNAVAESFFSHFKCESIYIMKNKIRYPQDVINVTEEYTEYYTNFRPQKKLGGMTPISYRNAYNIVLKNLLYYVYLNCTPLRGHSKPSPKI